MLAVGNALLGLQAFSFLKTKKQFKLLFQLVVEKMDTLIYRCKGASIFSSGLCFVFPDEGAIDASNSGRPGGIGPTTGACPACPPIIPVWLQTTTR